MIVLGPVPCQGCRLSVYWDGWEWKRPADHKRHVCHMSNARSARMALVGSGDESASIARGARLRATTLESGVVGVSE